jgi:hypothetical protein
VSDIATAEEVLTWPNGELVDAESIRAYTDEARVLASAHTEDEDDGDNEIRTPDWVIQQLADVSRTAGRMTLVILNAETLKRQAATKLERAKAQARWDSRSLPEVQRAARVILDTADEKDEYDLAVAAFEYARRIGNLLKDYTSRVQTIGKQIELTYAGAGRRGGA